MGWFDSMAAGAPQSGGSSFGWAQSPSRQAALQPGSLAALGGGMNSPQPVPGMPPRQMPDWPQFQTPPTLGGPPELSFDSLMKNGAPSWMQGDPSQHSDQGGWGGNRGSGQPISQPNLGMADNPMAPIRQPGFVPPDPSQMAYTTGQGSLQSLGGFGMDPAAVQRGAQGAAQIGQMINLRGPDGSTKAVPQSDLAHWLSRGAQQIQGAF